MRIYNGISLSRGLGSSAAAVVAGVMLGNEVGQLNLSKERMFDYCLMIERHPDNVGAALFGVMHFSEFITPFYSLYSLLLPKHYSLPKSSSTTRNADSEMCVGLRWDDYEHTFCGRYSPYRDTAE